MDSAIEGDLLVRVQELCFVVGQLMLVVMLVFFMILWRLDRRMGAVDQSKDTLAGMAFIVAAVAVNTLVALAMKSFGVPDIMIVAELAILFFGLLKMQNNLKSS